MFNRSEILKAAWAQCKAFYLHRGRTFRFVASEFRWALQCAWRAAKLAAMAATERRVETIKEQLSLLDFKHAHVNVDRQRLALEAELRSLTA